MDDSELLAQVMDGVTYCSDCGDALELDTPVCHCGGLSELAAAGVDC